MNENESTNEDEPHKKQSFWQSIRRLLHGTDEDFTEGNLHRAVGLLAVPMVLEMAGESVFAICDAFFVAKLGSAALAAVGLTESMMELVYALAIGLSMATTALVARRIGEKEPKAAAHAAVQAIAIAVFISIIFGVLGMIYSRRILALMGGSAETVEIGAPYTFVMYGGMVVVLLLFINNAIFRAAGDAAIAMRSLWIANAINLILDPCLIFGLGPFPELGLLGAAIATTIGRGTAVIYQFWSLGHGNRIRISFADIGIDFKVMWSIIRLSAGGVGQMLISTSSYIGLIRILATFETFVLAGYVIAIRIVIFVILPAWGFSNAAATLVGQNLGAKKPDRAEKAVWITGLWNMLFMAIVSVIFLFFSPPIIGIFTKDPQIRDIGVQSLSIISYGYIFYAWGMVMMQAFNGAGDTTTPTAINFFCFWLFQIPLAWLLALNLGVGPKGVFWAISISYSLSAIVGIMLFRRGKWRDREV